MTITLQRIGKAALLAAAALVLVLGFAWQVLPGIIQSQAQKFVAEKSGHRLTVGTPEINPLRLSVRLRDLRLEDPEGEPLLAVRELFVDLAAVSLMSRTLTFDLVQVDGLQASAVLRNGAPGPLNWSRLLAAFAGGEAPRPDAPPPRIDIRHLVVTGAQADIADLRTTPPFVSRIESFDLELHDISTLPNDAGRFKLTAKTSFGAQLEWTGEAALNPLGSRGHVDLRGIDLGKLGTLLKPHLPPELGLASPEAVASLELDYRLGHAKGQLDLVLEPVAIKLSGLALRRPQAVGAPLLAIEAIELQQGRFDIAGQQLAVGALAVRGLRLEAAREGNTRGDLLSLAEIVLAPAHIDLARRSAKIGAIELKGGSIAVRRDARGGIDLPAALQALAPPTASPGRSVQEQPAAPWRYEIERVGLTGFDASVRDESTTPAFNLGFEDIAIVVQGVSDKLHNPLPVRAALRVKSGGRLTLDGTVVPSSATVDLQLKLEDLALKPAQAYLAPYAALDLASGRLGAVGKLLHNEKTSAYRGSFALSDLRLDEAGTQTAFLAWKSLATRQLEVTPAQLHIGELTLDGLDTQLLIAKDKSTNFKRILRHTGATAADSTVPSAVAASSGPPSVGQASALADGAQQKAEAPGFLVDIDRLRFRNGELDFADESLLLPFGTRIHRLRGSLAGLSSRPGARGQLELDGEVDDYGLARAAGQVDLFNPTDFMDIRVIFRNVEMTRLTPYSATFAGRRIDSGKLSVDLDYVIKKRQLESVNKIVIERLVLGERVASPSAKDLPLDLAIALLEDSDGRIDLGLPVSGSLDDPQFSYGGLVWKVITNVLTKIVTAPFRALGALFGGSDEKLESIAFEAGARRLTPPEREKLLKLAAALNKRPALALTVQGTWNEADRNALQDLQLRRTLLERSGATSDGGGDTKGDPGPVSTRQPEIQAALEALFGERIGKSELAGLKQGFRSANPGQLEESATGKVMSRLSGLISPPRTLSADEIGALKGADLHAVLYQRLRDKEILPDERLRQLARTRGETALAALKEAKAPAERVILRDPEKLEGGAREIPLKLTLGRAGS